MAERATGSGQSLDEAAVGRVARRYRACGRFARHYVAAKLRHDPLTATLLRESALGTVLDLGCGRGQFAGLLLESGLASCVTGFDVSRVLLDQARVALAGLAFRAVEQDLARDAGLPAADTVLLADMLYQVAPAAQERLLRSACAAAGSRMLIRTADPDAGWRGRFTSGVERLGRRFWPHSGAMVAPRPVAWVAAVIAEAGFRVERAPSYRGTPFGNALLTAVREKAVREKVGRERSARRDMAS